MGSTTSSDRLKLLSYATLTTTFLFKIILVALEGRDNDSFSS